ncbi:transcription initiation factor TFIID subunit 4 [Scheffersomyces spartinae]|uniref:Transcription initiation factor TFIID subunit 4 n=1 Tax=Scheffersomyces spartinae TaxID=45513 RepID=A0A9P7V7E6_9ASCO|nr:transcription initiation factor TFIID subunit 4 [Scheffersomyces spartinae]KAG7192759.1 transcription initiation factor TFIID subunit 4 [Scheffersomyces spartinae]
MEGSTGEKRPSEATTNDTPQTETPDGKRPGLDQQLDELFSTDPLAEFGGESLELDAITDDMIDTQLFLDDIPMMNMTSNANVNVSKKFPTSTSTQFSGGEGVDMIKSHSMTDILRNTQMQHAFTKSGLGPGSGSGPGYFGGGDILRSTNSHTNLPSAVKGGAGDKPVDARNLNDALAVAGVDLQQEEELLALLQLERRGGYDIPRGDYRMPMRIQRPPQTFLYQGHLAGFMHRIAKQNGVAQNFFIEMDILELMLASCETWLSNILTKTVIHSRHRRRNIASTVSSSLKHRTKNVPTVARSEISRELRNLANKQKELEEKRVLKRIALGLEKSSENGYGDEDNKAGAEETLHRAANATAAMMTTGKKKYSWATSGAGSDETSSEKDGKGKKSLIISRRGDNGLRFREIRTGAAITMKDLLTAIENERIGTSRALVKGYAKLKD